MTPTQRMAALFAATVVGVTLATITLATLVFANGGRLCAWTLPVAVAATTVAVFFWSARTMPKRAAVVTAGTVTATALVVIIGTTIGDAIFDGTFDGRWFHREAIIQLTEGWNPLYDVLSLDEVPDDAARARIEGYPKGPWLVAASLFALTGRIETATAFSFALLLAAAASVYAATLGIGHIGKGRAAALGAVAALNPIAVCQLANSQVDGQLASMLVVVVAAGVLLYRTESGLALTLLVMALAVGVNTKQSAVPFLALIVGGLVVAGVVISRRMPQRRSLAVVAAAFVIGVAVIGIHSHVTNLTRHGNWAYPHGTRIATGKVAPVLEATSIGRLHSFLKSAFSRSQHADNLWSSRTLLATEAELKLPFTVSYDELIEFRSQGVRIGGGGPLYGAMLLAGLATLAMLLAVDRVRAGHVMLVMLPVAVSVLAFPYPWVFRLVPQAWLLPLIPAAAALSLPRRWAAAFGGAVLAIGAVNVAGVGWVWTSAAIQHTDFLVRRMELLRATGPLGVHFGSFRAERVRLADHDVEFTEVEDTDHWLGVFLGWSKPDIVETEPLPGSDKHSLAVEWSPVAGTTEYAVSIIEDAPAGPGSGALTVLSRRVNGRSASLPRPPGRFSVTVAACNLLGCGLPSVMGPLDGGSDGLPSPLLGVPFEGEAVETPMLIAWLPATGAGTYRVVVEDTDKGEVVLDETTVHRYLKASLAAHGRWRVQVTADGDNGVTESQPVEFRTTTPRGLALLQPEFGTTLQEGPVTLAWEAVDGASAYEYLVMEPGGQTPAARGVTTALTAEVELPARGEETQYSFIARACPREAVCRGGRDRGWGLWTTELGTGAVNFTVVPTRDAPPVDQ